MEIIKGVQTMCRYAMSGPYKDIYACFICLEQQEAGKGSEGKRLLQRLTS
ncbi:hypothetical protein [Paenibacillus amylolyticus]